MPLRHSVFRLSASVVTTIILAALISGSLFAQTASPSAADRAWVGEFVRFYGLESRATPVDIDRLAQLQSALHERSATLEARQNAYVEIFGILYRLLGTDPVPPEPAVRNAAQFYAQTVHNRVTSGEASPVSTATTPRGQLGRVDKAGRGPVPMILIADLGLDGKTLYGEFMRRNADRYTMYAVTLAGFGGTPPPARAARYEPFATPFWDSARAGILDLIEKNRLDKPVVVGMQSSSYLAARLALDHADKFRAVVMLDGSSYTPFRSIANQDLPATDEERRILLTTRLGPMGIAQDFLPLTIPTRAAAERILENMTPQQRQGTLGINTRDTARGKTLFVESMATSDPRTMRYSVELLGVDLRKDLARLSVPALLIASVHDDNSPGQGGVTQAVWTEVKLRYPKIPLQIVPFENTRNYVTEEAAEDLDRALAAFLAGKRVEVARERGPLAARPSPRAALHQAVGAAELAISYSRPQVNKRQVWGQLVPTGRVWRAGANEATRMTISADLMVEGQMLPAGTYALFMIPNEGEWTVIFNRIAEQWGAFSYNPEFDALRVKVKPQTAEHEEWLSYGAEPLSPTSAQIFLRWEKVKVPFKVEVPQAKTAGGN